MTPRRSFAYVFTQDPMAISIRETMRQPLLRRGLRLIELDLTVERNFAARADSRDIAIALTAPESSAAWAELDSVARRAQFSWLPVAFEHPFIRVGPLFGLGRRPCLTCFDRRRKQAARSMTIGRTEAVRPTPSEASIGGDAPHQVAIVAALCVRAFDASDDVGVAGRLLKIDTRNDQLLEEWVAAVHACPDCNTVGRHADGARTRLLSYAEDPCTGHA